MAYTNRTIRLDFPELGDDIWVVINNPLLMPVSRLQSDVDVQMDDNNRPVNSADAVNATLDIASKLIVSWNVFDPFDESDEAPVLPLPATVETMAKVPMVIVTRISEIVGKALTPKS